MQQRATRMSDHCMNWPTMSHRRNGIHAGQTAYPHVRAPVPKCHTTGSSSVGGATSPHVKAVFGHSRPHSCPLRAQSWYEADGWWRSIRRASSMTVDIERFANYQDDTTPQSTHFEQQRPGGHPASRRPRRRPCALGRRCPCASQHGRRGLRGGRGRAIGVNSYDNFATIEAALVHLEAVRDRLRAFAAIEAPS